MLASGTLKSAAFGSSISSSKQQASQRGHLTPKRPVLPVLAAWCRTSLLLPSPRPCTFHFQLAGQIWSPQDLGGASNPAKLLISTFCLRQTEQATAIPGSLRRSSLATSQKAQPLAVVRVCLNLNHPSPRSDHIESRRIGRPNHRTAWQTDTETATASGLAALPNRAISHTSRLPSSLAGWLAGWLFDTSTSCHLISLAGGTALQVPASKCQCQASAARCSPVV